MALNRTTQLVGFFPVAVIYLFPTTVVSQTQSAEDDRWINGVTEPWWFDPATVPREEIAAARPFGSRLNPKDRMPVVTIGLEIISSVAARMEVICAGRRIQGLSS